MNFVRIGHIREFDGLRGIAILLVMFNHLGPIAPLDTVLGYLKDIGWLGVDLFFVLSGCLITGILVDTHGEPGYFRNFYARRILRIFPLYYLFLAFIFLTIPMTQDGSYFATPFMQEAGSPGWYVLFLTNLKEYFTGSPAPLVLQPLWSLAVEEQFYLAFPLCVYFCRNKLLWLIIGVIVFSPLFRTLLWLNDPVEFHAQYLLTPARIDNIAWGCLLALVIRKTEPAKLAVYANWLLLLAVVAAVALLYWHGLNRRTSFMRIAGYSLTAMCSAALVLWAHCRRGTVLASPLRIAPLCYIGKLCYGIYMLHFLTAFVLDALFTKMQVPINIDGYGMMLVKMVAAVAVASVSWFVFEKPILRLRARFEYRVAPDAASTDSGTNRNSETHLTPVTCHNYPVRPGAKLNGRGNPGT